MKYLKLFESFEDIDSICKKYGIKNYTINEDGSIDVDVDVDVNLLYGAKVPYGSPSTLTKLPLKFGEVSGDFKCSNYKITSTEGFPVLVGGDLVCSANELTSFDGISSVVGDLVCTNNKIRTFEGFPKRVGYLYCSANPVYVFWDLFRDIDKIELFNDFGITDGEVVILDRLNEFLEMIGKPILNDKSYGDAFIIDRTTPSDIEKAGYRIIT